MLTNDEKKLVKVYTITKDEHKLRLDRFLKEKGLFKSRKELAIAFSSGQIFVNGKAIKRNFYFLKKGDRISIHPLYTLRLDGTGEIRNYASDKIEILYETDQWVAVIKPASMLSVPVPQGKESLLTLVERILSSNQKERWLYPVHRLDYEVSGIILFAKNKEAAKRFGYIFQHRQIKKYYIAEVDCKMKNMNKKNNIIELPINKTPDRITGLMFINKESGMTAKTLFKPISDNLILLSLKTGRRHQLRLHLASIGLPIRNDILYGHKGDAKAIDLYSIALQFRDPFTKEKIKLFYLPEHLKKEKRNIKYAIRNFNKKKKS